MWDTNTGKLYSLTVEPGGFEDKLPELIILAPIALQFWSSYLTCLSLTVPISKRWEIPAFSTHISLASTGPMASFNFKGVWKCDPDMNSGRTEPEIFGDEL